jgi:hypothetical protein
LPRFRAISDAVSPTVRAVLAAVWWAFTRPVAGVAWVRGFRPELWSVEGAERTSGLPLSILCGLKGESKTYVLDVIFGDSYSQRRLGRFWWWNLRKAISKAPGCSLIVLDLDVSHLKFAGGKDWFLIPVWVLGEVDLPYEEHIHSRLRTKLRSIIRRSGYQFEVTRDPQHFEDFYHNMYVPYVKQTYGKCARVNSHEFLGNVFRESELVLLKAGEKSVAGYLLMHGEAGTYLLASGIRDGSRQYVEDGAGAALYHFCLQHLHEQGHKKAFLGWSRTFLRDGVLIFKKRLAQRIVGSNDDGFALTVVSYTPAATAFLQNNPFLFKRGGDLCGAVFVAGDQPLCAENIEQIHKDHFHPGMSRLFVYRLPGECPLPADTVSPEFARSIELCLAAERRSG